MSAQGFPTTLNIVQETWLYQRNRIDSKKAILSNCRNK